jgi:uncharacterized membrane protein YbhN (UPF0104 family)
LAGLVSLATVKHQAGLQFGGALLFLIALLVASAGLSLVRVPKRLKQVKRLRKGIKILESMTTGWQTIMRDRGLMTTLAALIVAQLGLTMVIAWFETTALGAHISAPGLLLFAVLGSLSIFINLTPANLGVKEAIFLATSSVIGLTAAQIVAIALLDRAVLFVTLGVLWLATGRQSWTQT